MAPLTTASRALAQSALRSQGLVAARALSTSKSLRDAASATFESPFRGTQKSTKVPSFGKYMQGSGNNNLLFQYFMVGALGAITAAGAKSTVQGESCCLSSTYTEGAAGRRVWTDEHLDVNKKEMNRLRGTLMGEIAENTG
jgi:hypothetical protein